LPVVARELERRAPAEPLMDTTADFKAPILAIRGIAGQLERRPITNRGAQGRPEVNTLTRGKYPG